MNDKLVQRFNALKSEYDAGQKMLNELDQKRAQVVQTMTRIEGAMMVLRELIEGESAGAVPINGTATDTSYADIGS